MTLGWKKISAQKLMRADFSRWFVDHSPQVTGKSASSSPPSAQPSQKSCQNQLTRKCIPVLFAVGEPFIVCRMKDCKTNFHFIGDQQLCHKQQSHQDSHKQQSIRQEDMDIYTRFPNIHIDQFIHERCDIIIKAQFPFSPIATSPQTKQKVMDSTF